VKLPPIPVPKDSLRISEPREVDLTFRPAVQVSLGPVLVGAALPHPDPHDPATMIAGVGKRFGLAPPKPNKLLLASFKKFVKKWVRKNLIKLPADLDLSVDTWLANTAYPESRKAELRKIWEKVGALEKLQIKDFLVKSFQKDETYDDYKHARGINARTDEFKCAVGPYFKAIEHVLFQHACFIKYIPVQQRPDYIYELLYSPNGKYMATDYTAFEALFTKELMESCEFELYDYMTEDLPEHARFMALCRNVLGGCNNCYFKNFKVALDATRMSGEMCTSLGNSFTNLMAMLFMCKQKGVKNVKGVVEGDDGLFVGEGDFPTVEDFAQLGLILKMEVHSDLCTASFCGIVFDTQDKTNIYNPLKVLASYGWTSRYYNGAKMSTRMALLRAKSLSLLYQYPGCPIVSALAEYGLRVTRSYDIRNLVRKGGNMNNYQREWLRDTWLNRHLAVRKPVGERTRFLVERLYGIRVEDQLIVEKILDNKNDLEPLKLDVIAHLFPPSWVDYWDNYVLQIDCGSRHKNDYPPQCWDQTRFPVIQETG